MGGAEVTRQRNAVAVDLRGAVADAWEILANIGGNRGHPGSCALRALANVQKGRVGTSLARYWRCGAVLYIIYLSLCRIQLEAYSISTGNRVPFTRTLYD
jgi:hypothetical protein